MYHKLQQFKCLKTLNLFFKPGAEKITHPPLKISSYLCDSRTGKQVSCRADHLAGRMLNFFRLAESPGGAHQLDRVLVCPTDELLVKCGRWHLILHPSSAMVRNLYKINETINFNEKQKATAVRVLFSRFTMSSSKCLMLKMYGATNDPSHQHSLPESCVSAINFTQTKTTLFLNDSQKAEQRNFSHQTTRRFGSY